MSKQLAITSLLANRATGQKTPRVPLQVQPAAKPKLGPRPQQHEAGQQQEQQQEQQPLKRAKKGTSTGEWRQGEKYGLTPAHLALYPWAASVEGQVTFCECLVCSDFKKHSVRVQARSSTLKTHARSRAHQDASQAVDRTAEAVATQQVLRAGNQAIFDKALALADKENLPQFKTAFHLLSFGRSMLEYEQSYQLYSFLSQPVQHALEGQR